MSAPRQRRFSLEPLMTMAGADGLSVLAKRAGVDARDIYRWHGMGGVTELWADRLAVRCGFNPIEVWPEWAEAATRPAEMPVHRSIVLRRERQARYRQNHAEEIAAYKRAYNARLDVKNGKRRYSQALYGASAEQLRAKRRQRYQQQADLLRPDRARRRSRYSA